MQTWHIHLKGQVQGVGFRPFVFLLAQQYQLKGWVNNDVDGVHIECMASQSKVVHFLENLLANAPTLSQITDYEIVEIPAKNFSTFQIKPSDATKPPNLLVTPDAAICTDCKKEIFQTNNRRTAYPFTTCTNCGPRYSIIQQLPYDRSTTTMDAFKMCSSCQQEFDEPTDRRYYAQTNSCPTCAIPLELYELDSKVGSKLVVSNTAVIQIIEKVVQLWQAGKIVAIKGIGGYLLTADASKESVVQTLRIRKHRPSKPFAILFPTLEKIERTLHISPKEKKWLTSSTAPIVLLQTKETTETLAPSIAPRLQQIGAMLPYTPLYQLLLKRFNKPIIATSGNSSNSPIIFKNKKALSDLFTIADFVLTDDRAIVIPQDDSVVKITPFKQQKIILRRSRGYAPTYIHRELNFSNTSIVAMGAMLKSTFSLLHQSNIFISQYLGDLENFDTQENYRHTLTHFLRLFQTQPQLILLDQHPQYASSLYGQTLATQLKIPTFAIQHQEAHFAAILGEHNLLDIQEPILGVIWDGTGLGTDGHIWGGEFFVYENYHFQRRHHLEYRAFLAGDKMPREPRISALSFFWGIEAALPILKEKFTPIEWGVYTKLLKKETTLKTSSIGRLFDAVAAILGILDKQTYEGEAALLLETKAISYFQKVGFLTLCSSFKENMGNFNYTTNDLLKVLLADLLNGASIAYIAARFHFLLVCYIEQVALDQGIQKIAFSGGVFQNGLLVDLLIHFLGDAYELYFHEQLSPNDENVSFGQVVWYHISLQRT